MPASHFGSGGDPGGRGGTGLGPAATAGIAGCGAGAGAGAHPARAATSITPEAASSRTFIKRIPFTFQGSGNASARPRRRTGRIGMRRFRGVAGRAGRSGALARAMGSGGLLFVLADLLVVGIVGGDAVVAVEPGAEVEIAAARGTEGPVAR